MTRKIVHELKRAFPNAVLEVTGGSHLRITLPNGKTVIASSTPSCRFALNNVKRDMRRSMDTERGAT
jgi:hypothetical protein